MRTVDFRFLTILVVSVVVLGGAFHALHGYQVTQQQKVYVREADRAIEGGNPASAVDYLQRYLRLDRTDFDERLRLARLLRDTGRFQQSQSYYTQVLQGGADHFGPYEMGTIEFERARIAMELGFYEIARKDLESLLSRMETEEFRGLAEAADEPGSDNENASENKLAQPMEPNESEAHELLGRCLLVLEDPEGAREAFLAAISSNPARLTSYGAIAELSMQSLTPPRPGDAVQQLVDLVQNNSDNPDAYVLRARLFLQQTADTVFQDEVREKLGVSDSQMQYEEETGGATASADASPTNPLAIVTDSIKEEAAAEISAAEVTDEDGLSAGERVVLWWALADARTATALVDTAAKTGDDTLGPLIVRMQAARSLGLNDEAEEFAERAIATAPETALPYAVVAEIQVSRDVLEAAVTLEQGLKECGDDPSLLWILANIRIGQDDIEEARELKKRLPTDTPAIAPYQTFLDGRIFVAEKKWREAWDAFESIQYSLLKNSAMEQEEKYWLAVCQQQLGRADLAEQTCRDALQLDPTSLRPRVMLAELLAAAGKTDEAIQQYRLVSRAQGQNDAVSVDAARLMTRKHVAEMVAERRWADIDSFLSQMRGQIAEDTDLRFVNSIDLLEAEVLVVRGESDAADTLLEEAIRQRPDEEDLWVARSALARFRQDYMAAEQFLDAAESQFGETLAIRLARVQVAASQGGTEAVVRLQQLAIPPESWSAADNATWEDELAWYIGRIALSLLDPELTQGQYQHVAELAEEQLRHVAGNDQSNLGVRLLLFDLALRMARLGETSGDRDPAQEDQAHAIAIMADMLQELEGIEGADGPYLNYAAAVKLAVEAELQNEPGKHAEALQRLQIALGERPKWYRIPMLEGQIRLTEGQDLEAASALVRAFELGMRDPRTVRVMISLLNRQGLFQQAARVVEKLSVEGVGNEIPDLAQQAFELSRITNDPDLSDVAFNSLTQRIETSEIPADHLLYGHLLRQQNRSEEATQHFEEAVRLGPSDPGNWLALIIHLLEMDRESEAQDRLSEAAAAMAEEDRLLGLARGHEILAEFHERRGDVDQAREDLEQARSFYDEAIIESPRDSDTLRTVATFHLRQGHTEECEQLLNRLLQLGEAGAESHRWARRSLAAIVLTRGTYVALQRALELAEENLAEENAAEANTGALELRSDQRLKALILSRWPMREPDSRKESIDLYSELINRQELASSGDRATLASLHLAERDYHSYMAEHIEGPDQADHERKSQQHLQNALDLLRRLSGDVLEHAKTNDSMLSDEEAGYVSKYIDTLLADGQVGEADRWTGRLDQYSVDKTTCMLLYSEIAFRRTEHQTARQRLTEYISRLTGEEYRKAAPQVAARFESFADRIEKQDQPDETNASHYRAVAEEVYRHYGQAAPDRSLVVAGFLARQGRVDEALELINSDWATNSDGALVSAATSVLQNADENGSALEQLSQLLGQALRDRPESSSIKLAAADVFAWKGDVGRAIPVYREILKQNPNHVIAANNLAFLLASEKQDLQVALQLINHSIDLKGPVPALLDTRAVVLRSLNRPTDALRDLASAEQQMPSASFQMRRAQILFGARHLAEAKAACANALAMGYSIDDAHPLEREEMTQLLLELR